jgi:phosphate acyltransferase
LTRIALDAMGGDHAPHAPVAGALLALSELPSHYQIDLVGPAALIAQTLSEQTAHDFSAFATHRERLSFVEAPDVIAMTDKPTVALRGKPNSSMVVGLKRVVEGQADGFVSAGNTGAQMAASTLLMRLHGSLTRPAIATIFPTAKQPVVVLDSGANVDCSADELVQFARIGAVYAEDILGRTSPRIGLLSIGEEPEKGNAAVKEAHQRLAQSGLNFIGNVEGRDIPRGECDRGLIDVVVCDGFTGNVLLKFYEALAPMLVKRIASAANADPKALATELREFDHAEYGGAPLLGVKGVSIIAHGSSDARAIKNAIKVGIRAVESRMSDHIGMSLASDAASQ